MKLIIDIPDELYEALVINQYYGSQSKLENIIINGTPLPKGHGRLIDYGYVVDAIDDWINAEEYKYTNATDYLRKRIKDISTIIEGSDSK